MICGLSGIVSEREKNALLVEKGGITFRVLCSPPVLEQGKKGESITLHTHFHVREQEMSLYGFLEKSELQLFQKLIGVSGIGPRTALEILVAGGAAVHAAIVSGDVAFLCSVKGIGKKTAERAILELREKLSDISFSASSREKIPLSRSSEVLDVLQGLGWSKTVIENTLQECPKDLKQAEEIVRWFLTQKAQK